MTSLLFLAQATVSYTNLALQLMVGDANYYAGKLKLKESLPIQVTNLIDSSISDRMSAVSGYIKTSNYLYEFTQGRLESLSRNDVFEENQDSRTNPASTFREREAVEYSRGFLETFSFDMAYVSQKFRRTFQAAPAGSHSFYLDSRFRSRNHMPMARLAWELDSTEWNEQFHSIDFYYYEPTKELVAMRLAPGYITSAPVIWNHPLLVVTNAADIVVPAFFSGEATSAVYRAVISTNEVKGLVAKAHAEMRRQLGTNKAGCYFVSDNLNLPDVVAKEAKALLSDAPWMGTSDRWRDDLPFPREEMDRVGSGKRGISILAVAGSFSMEIHSIPAVNYQPAMRKFPPNETQEDEKEWRAARSEGEKYLKIEASKLAGQFHLSDKDPNIMLLLLSENSPGTTEWEQSFSALMAENATVEDRLGFEIPCPRRRSIYLDGKSSTNVIAAVCLSGPFPYGYGFFPGSHSSGGKGRVDDKIITSLFNRYKFKAHPLEDIALCFTERAIEIMRNADRVEAIRVELDWERKYPKAKKMDGYHIIGFAPEQPNTFARALTQAVANERYTFGSVGKACIFQPGVIFKCWRGKEMVKLTICFNCDDMWIAAYDEQGKEFATTIVDFGRNRPELVKLCQKAFPDDATISQLKEKDDSD
ncbi:MAG: hypothetical protein JWM68_447 [Verrucomicrobiales bacterium]|nr:hypothetical protein [Verrucomicrobiales bacterium]